MQNTKLINFIFFSFVKFSMILRFMYGSLQLKKKKLIKFI